MDSAYFGHYESANGTVTVAPHPDPDEDLHHHDQVVVLIQITEDGEASTTWAYLTAVERVIEGGAGQAVNLPAAPIPDWLSREFFDSELESAPR